MALFSLQNLGRNIVRRAANSPLTLAIELEFGGQTEISDLDFHFVVDEEVTQFEIPVDDSVTVHVLDCRADLVHVALHLELVQSLTASQQLIQRLVCAQLQQDVNVFSVFKEVLEPDDVVVVQRAMNLDFRHQLRLCTRLSQGALHNDLGGLHLLVFQIGNFVTLGETSLAQELAFEVLFDYVVAIELDDTLFDDGLGVFLWGHVCAGRGCSGHSLEI